MRKKNKRPALHRRIHAHIKHQINKHVHKIFHIHHNFHHHLLHVGELTAVTIFTLVTGTWMFANLTGLNEEFYRDNSIEVAEALVEAMQNPGQSLKQGNIISVWKMDLNVENTFAKGYCTYGAARISPEFFPYIDSMTQQRTRGGNAVDRCKNAAETGYKIGTTPAQGALIVYDAGGKFGAYGHVGKVMHYDSSLKKIIVRDMAWVARGTMSDRWEDLTTAQVKCYIYNDKNTHVSHIESTVNTKNTITNIGSTNTSIVMPGFSSTVITGITAPKEPIIVPTVKDPIIPTPIIPTPTELPITPPVPVIEKPDTINKQLSLKLDNLSDIAQHFVQHNNLSFTLASNKPLSLGEAAQLTLEIKDKTTGKKYFGLLPFSFGIISTNDTLKAKISKITFVNDGKIDISVLGQKIGTTTIIITMDGTKIGEFSLTVK